MRRALFVLCTLVWASPQARADWRPVLAKEGIEVSQQPVEGRKVPMFRAVGTVAADPDRVLEVLQDVDQHTRWMPELTESRVVRQTEDEIWVYRLQNAPWPVSDRDMVVRSRIQVIDPGKDFRIDFDAVTLDEVPPSRGVIRVSHLHGHYRVQSIAPGRSRGEYEVDVDLGGSLPDWLASQVGRDNPIDTMLGLRAQLARD